MPPPPVAVYRSDDFLARTAFFLRFPVAALTEELENRTPSEQRTVKLILFLYDGYLSKIKVYLSFSHTLIVLS